MDQWDEPLDHEGIRDIVSTVANDNREPERYRRMYAATVAALDDGRLRLVTGDSLDAAWAEAEAALPEGWRLVQLMANPTGGWAAFAEPEVGQEQEGDGLTPAAALRALAAKLRG